MIEISCKRIAFLSLQEKEFLKMFQTPVIEVPTNLPNIRKDLPIQAFAVGNSTFILDFVLGLLYLNLTSPLGHMLFSLPVGNGNMFVKRLHTCLHWAVQF